MSFLSGKFIWLDAGLLWGYKSAIIRGGLQRRNSSCKAIPSCLLLASQIHSCPCIFQHPHNHLHSHIRSRRPRWKVLRETISFSCLLLCFWGLITKPSQKEGLKIILIRNLELRLEETGHLWNQFHWRKKNQTECAFSSRGDKGSCMPLFTLEKFKRCQKMLPEAGGGDRY